MKPIIDAIEASDCSIIIIRYQRGKPFLNDRNAWLKDCNSISLKLIVESWDETGKYQMIELIAATKQSLEIRFFSFFYWKREKWKSFEMGQMKIFLEIQCLLLLFLIL